MIETHSQLSRSILLVDDDDVFRERMARALRARGYSVETASDGATALAQCLPRRFGYAVIDLRMPGSSGLELLVALRERDANVRIGVLTGYGSVGSAVEAMRLGAWTYVSKPADADDIIRAIVSNPPLSRAHARTDSGSPPNLARAEWEHIQRVLTDCDGNVSETARRLAITRRTLQLKLKRGPLDA